MKTITEWDHKAKKFKTHTITSSGMIIKPPGAPLGDLNTPLSVQRAARQIKQERQKPLFGRKKR